MATKKMPARVGRSRGRGGPGKADKPGRPAAAAPEGDTSSPVAGESMGRRIAALRHGRQWTLAQLSAASGVSRSMLSEIERGSASPTIVVADRIARALGLTLGELVSPPDTAARPRIDIIRADDRASHYRSDPHCSVRTLSPLRLDKSVEFYEITLAAGGELRSRPHFQGARELLTVQQGTIRIHSGPESQSLSTGDSAYYPADIAHAIENTGQSAAIVFLVVTYIGE